MEKDIKDTKKDDKKDTRAVVNKLTEEEEQLKKNIEDMVKGLLDEDLCIKQNAYNLLKGEITNSTGTMTSIPKPLKFIRDCYKSIKEKYDELDVKLSENPEDSYLLQSKRILADVLCIITLVTDTQETILQYVIKDKINDFNTWGSELVRTLSGEISTEYLKRLDASKPYDDLIALSKIIVDVLVKSSHENEAIDLLVELEIVDDVKQICNTTNYKKICMYLITLSNYGAEVTEQNKILEVVFEIYTKYNDYTSALRVAIKLNDKNLIYSTFLNCKTRSTKLQMAFILAKCGIVLENSEIEPEVQDIMRNLKCSEYFKLLTRSLDILEPKHPDEIFKAHLEDKKDDIKIESYKINTSVGIANGFINAGFGTEKLLNNKKKDKSEETWLNKNKEEGLLCSIAGLGLVNLWDIEGGPNEIEKFMDNNEMNPYKRGGYNIALGLLSSGISDENETALALLSGQLEDKNLTVKLSSIFGLGLAYACTQNKTVLDELTKVLEDFSYGYDVSAFTSLCLGLVFMGSNDEDIMGTLISILIERNEGGKNKLIDSPFNLLYILGMGLIIYGNQKNVDLIIETTQIDEFPADLRLYIKTLLTTCAYAGSGNVIKIQEFQQLVAKKKDEINPKTKMLAIIGMSVIAIGEEMGMEMLPRSFNNFLQFGDVTTKKAVSLAYSLLSVSNPKLNILDQLLKFTFDNDSDVAMNSIFSLGLVSSGTNNSRINTELRKMAGAYAEDTKILPIIRIAQGLLNTGKGAVSLNPFYSENFLISNRAFAGILISVLCFTEKDALVGGKYQYLLYSLGLAMKPRMVMALDEHLNMKQIQLVIGQAVDIIGATGNPRSISGYQVNTSPLLINVGERCELLHEEFHCESNIIEDIIIITNKKQGERQ